MSPEYTHWDEQGRTGLRRASVALLVGGLLAGLVGGGVSAWMLLQPADVGPRLQALETRVGAVESVWPERLDELEARIEQLKVEVDLVGRRAEQFARLLAQARSSPPGAAVAERPRPERPGPPAVAPGLRLSGVITSQGARAALLEDGRDQAYVVHVGGALPAGRVVDISDEAVVIETISGGTLTIRIPR